MAIPNPPIRGHHLLSEGAVFKRHKPFTTLATLHDNDGVEWHGGCQCGAKPPEFPDISMRKMKAWHRQHKAELRGQQLHDTVTAEMQVEALKELIKDFEAWAEHQDWCDGFSGQETCSCGLGPLLERTKAALLSPTDVAPPPARFANTRIVSLGTHEPERADRGPEGEAGHVGL